MSLSEHDLQVLAELEHDLGSPSTTMRLYLLIQASRAAWGGLLGIRVDKAGELEGALRQAFGHDGPALVEVRTARHELSLPPKLTYGQIKGFTLYATRTILSGGGAELVELTRTNLRELEAG